MRQVIVSARCSNVGLGESGAKLAGGAEVGSTLGTGSCDAARLNDLHGDGAALLFLNLVFLVHAVHVDHALTHYAALGPGGERASLRVLQPQLHLDCLQLDGIICMLQLLRVLRLMLLPTGHISAFILICPFD